MIIHNTEWIEKLRIAREAKQWRASEIISDGQYDAIKTKYATLLYTPTLFIRIVLFFFTCIALVGVYGMVFLAAASSNASTLAALCVVVGLLSFVALEVIIKKRKLYKAGVEEALLYASLCFTIGGVVWLYLDGTFAPRHTVVPWIIALPFLIWGVTRFADRLVTAGAYVCALAIVLIPIVEGGTVAKTILPFAVMVFGMVSYFFARRYKRSEQLKPWRGCLFIMELLSLLTFYIGGNYFAVREGNGLLMMSGAVPDGDIPFAFLFYALTVAIPIAYIVRGLIARDHLLLRTGLTTAVLSVLTFRYYFHFVPPEVALTIAGLALFLIALFTTRFLRTEPNGFTDKNILTEKLKDVNAEALLVAQTLGASPQPSMKKDFEGGGGQFGGGGASGSWQE